MNATGDLNVIIVLAHGEKFVWIYPDGQEAAVRRSAARFAMRADLSFTTLDRDAVAKKIKQNNCYRRAGK